MEKQGPRRRKDFPEPNGKSRLRPLSPFFQALASKPCQGDHGGSTKVWQTLGHELPCTRGVILSDLLSLSVPQSSHL